MSDLKIKKIYDTCFDIIDPVLIDESIEKIDYIEYFPTVTDLNNAGSFEIRLENRESFPLINKSFIVFEGEIVKNDGSRYADADLIAMNNNGILHEFKSISYKLGTSEIENISIPGISTLMKGLLTYSKGFSETNGLMQYYSIDTSASAEATNTGFNLRKNIILNNNTTKGHFRILIPLFYIFGFAENFDKVTHGITHNLFFNRQNKDASVFRAGGLDVAEVNLKRVIWSVPIIKPNPDMYSKLLQTINNKTSSTIGFLGRQLETKSVGTTKHFRWDMISSLGVVRYIIIGFQSDREKNQEVNKGIFDHCNLTTAEVRLNSETYSSIKVCDFTNSNYIEAYKKFIDFNEKYTQKSEVSPIIFKTLYPLYVFDVSKQPEKLKTGSINVVFECMFSQNVAADTMAFALILYDRMIKIAGDGEKQIIKI